VNKAATIATQFDKCILYHAYSRATASSQMRQNKKIHIAYLTSCHNSIFGYKLRTIYNN